MIWDFYKPNKEKYTLTLLMGHLRLAVVKEEKEYFC